MARFVLDTDTCVYWLRGDGQTEKRILITGLQNVFITIIMDGQIKADLERVGRPLDDADLLIGAIALASNGTLVTNNTSHVRILPTATARRCPRRAWARVTVSSNT